jgi:hypothetical protein
MPSRLNDPAFQMHRLIACSQALKNKKPGLTQTRGGDFSRLLGLKWATKIAPRVLEPLVSTVEQASCVSPENNKKPPSDTREAVFVGQ